MRMGFGDTQGAENLRKRSFFSRCPASFAQLGLK